jgi:hypothetical protein
MQDLQLLALIWSQAIYLMVALFGLHASKQDHVLLQRQGFEPAKIVAIYGLATKTNQHYLYLPKLAK